MSSRQIAVVTGAAQGIGEAIGRAFVQHDFDVHLLDIQPKVAETAATLTDEGPGTATGHVCDLTDRERVAEVADRITSQGAKVHALANNAGWTPNVRFLEQDSDVWERIMAINLYSVFNTTSAFVPHMEAGSGIVNVASDAARVGVPKEAVYSAAKAGVIAFGKTMAVELGRSGIRVNTVSPGTTRTPLVAAELSDEQIDRRVRANPSGRLGEPHEVAEAVRWLACDAGYINGQVLSVNGGATRVG